MTPPTAPPGNASFRPLPLRRVALWLIIVAGGIIVIALVSLLGHQHSTGLISRNLHVVFWYFDVGREYNMATWYASGMWMLLGALASAIAATRPVFRRSWWVFAAVGLLASIDEYLELHERLDVPGDWLAARLPFDLGFTWVLLGAPIGLVIALVLMRLVFSLPRRARIGIIVAGALFLTGALGVETVNGMILARNDHVVDNAYIYGTMIEELFEMSGIAVALASVLSLIQRDAAHGTLRLDPDVRQRPASQLPGPARSTASEPGDLRQQLTK